MMSAWNQASHGVSTSSPPNALASSETVMFSAARLLATAPQVIPPAMMKMIPAMSVNSPTKRTVFALPVVVVVVMSPLPNPNGRVRTPWTR